MGRIVDALLRLNGGAAYAVVFGLAALEASAFIGLFVPGELAVLLGGVLAFQHKVSLVPIAVAASVGAIVGDSIGYAIGARLGPRILASRLGRMVGRERMDRANRYLREHGTKAVIVGRFTAALRVLVPGLAGMARMPYGRFLLANVIGGILWATSFTTLGFVAGSAWRRIERAAGRASLILLALVIVVGAIVVAARWVVRHPERVRALAERVGMLRPVAWMRRRFGAQVAFAGRRFDPRAATGLRLTAGLAAIAVFGWLFGVLAEDVIAGNESVRFDLPLARAIARNTTPALASAMRMVTAVGSGVLIESLAVAISVAWLLVRRSWFAARLLTVSLVGATVVVAVVKALARRPRPPVAHLVAVSGWSFPSGHAVRAAVFFGACAILAGRVWPGWRARAWAWAAAVIAATLMGASRLVLGVHYLTDVLAGLTLGTLWLVVAATLIRTPDPGRRGLPCEC